MRLIADIGGTNARFAAVDDGIISDPLRLVVADYPSFVNALTAVSEHYSTLDFDEAVVAVAGPVRDNRCKLTNADWTIDAIDIATAIGAARVKVVNDFEAVALAINFLEDAERLPLGAQPGEAVSDSLPRLAMGPGTGLGVSVLHRAGSAYYSVATEGGHVPPPVDDPELLRALRSVAPPGPLEAETFLSGTGLGLLHQALSGEVLANHEVSRRARTDDAKAIHTASVFFDLLARFAANAVLSTGALGGVYMGGGLIEHELLPLDGDAFRRSFIGTGRMSALLAQVPTFAIKRADPAFLGIARVDLTAG